MGFLYKYPFVRILFIYIISLLNYDLKLVYFLNYFFEITGFLFLCLFLLFIYFEKNVKYGTRWIWGLGVLTLLFSIGLLNSELRDERLHPNHWSHSKPTNHLSEFFLVKVLDNPIEKMDRVRTCCEIEKRLSNGKSLSASGKILVYFPKKEIEKQGVMAGDLLLVAGVIQPINGSTNPMGFDPCRYFGSQQIYGQLKINSGCWRRLPYKSGWSLTSCVNSAKAYLQNAFTSGGLLGREYAVAIALVFGLRSDMDPAIISAFSASGAMHILSVSGMHIGMIFIALEFLLRFLNRRWWLKVVKFILILIFIWTYSLLSGFSPSVLRASLMLSFVILGEWIGRKGSSLNTVCLTAFCLLFFDPDLLKNLGFQLSFMAVLGIVLWYGDFYSIFSLRIKLLDWLWSVSALSIVATISTLPLCLYYFNQFPNFFLLSNYLVIPVSNVVVYLGIGLSLVGWNPCLAQGIGTILNWTVWLLNEIVFTIENLPGAVTRHLYLTWWDLIYLYALIFCFVGVLYNKSVRLLQIFLMLLIIYQTLGIGIDYSEWGKKAVAIYKAKNGTGNVIQLMNGGMEEVLIPGSMDSIPNQVSNSVAAVSNQFCVYESRFRFFSQAYTNASGWVYWQFGDIRLLILTGKVKAEKPLPSRFDIIYLGKSVRFENVYSIEKDKIGLVVLEQGMSKKKKQYFVRMFGRAAKKVIDMSDGGVLLELSELQSRNSFR